MSRKLLNLGLTVFVLAFFTIVSSASGGSRFLPCDTDCAELETQAEPEPTESPQSSRDLNPVMIGDASVTSRPYDMGLGGYVDPEIHPYREVVEGDTVVLDFVGGSDQQFGLITLEIPKTWEGRDASQQLQLEFPETKLMLDGTYKSVEEIMGEGFREFWLTAYAQSHDLGEIVATDETTAEQAAANRAQAEQMLANDEPLEFTWTDDATAFETAGMATENISTWTRKVVPSAGVSYVILDQPIPVPMGQEHEYPGIATSYFANAASGEAGFQYGFEVTENGRLIIAVYRDGEDSIGETTAIFNATLDALRIIKGKGEFILRPAYHTAFERIDEYMRPVSYAFGLGYSTRDEAPPNDNWEEFSLVRVK